MANANVNNPSKQTSKEQENQSENALQRQQHGGITRGGQNPFGSWLTPEDFFRGNPFTLMRRMSEEMDRTFGQFFGNAGTGSSRGWLPEIEVREQDGQLHVHADLPGMKPE